MDLLFLFVDGLAAQLLLLGFPFSSFRQLISLISSISLHSLSFVFQLHWLVELFVFVLFFGRSHWLAHQPITHPQREKTNSTIKLRCLRENVFIPLAFHSIHSLGRQALQQMKFNHNSHSQRELWNEFLFVEWAARSICPFISSKHSINFMFFFIHGQINLITVIIHFDSFHFIQEERNESQQNESESI